MANFLISDMVKYGFCCPICSSTNIHGGYHVPYNRTAYICQSCGIHWVEDFAPVEEVKMYADIENDKMTVKKHVKQILTRRNKGKGFVWMLHYVGSVSPIKDPRQDVDPNEGFGSNKE